MISFKYKKEDNKKKIIEFNKEKIYSLPYTFFKRDYTPIVPLTVYQTWFSKNLPSGMHKSRELLKSQNPRFEFYLYDDNECREFIKKHFNEDVLNAFDSLIPGAFKADLWRLCILYINGGIYMDIKMTCVNGFKLIELTENEHFVLDRVGCFESNTKLPIFNALLVCKKNNPFLLLGINKIVENVKNKYYGPNPLYPTGPGMLGDIIENNNIKLNIDLLNYDNSYMLFKNRFVISIRYPEYFDEKNESYKTINKKHYDYHWKEKNVYK
jgi:mannosyltransferase OCH1-like enzyme